MRHEQAVMDLMRTKILYGVHVMMNANKMADRVLAALRSAFFSCTFFFFLFGCLFNIPLGAGFGIFFAFSGILMSGICDSLLD